MVQKTIGKPGLSLKTCEFARRGPFPNQKELDNQLVFACIMGRTDLARAVLDKGADPDAKGPDGKRVLMIVAMENFYEIGQLLIKCGADIWAKDNGGFSAYSYANSFGSKNMRRLLEQEMAA